MRPAALFVAAFLFLPMFSRAAVPENDSRQTEVATYKTHFTFPEYGTLPAWEARKEHLRRQVLSAAGLLPMPERAPIQWKLIRRVQYRDYWIETILIETLPGYYLGANLYRPARLRGGPAAGVLIPHGHWKKGRLEDLPSYSVPALGINLARQGYIALAYDMVGYNDTRQTPHNFGGWAETLWSFTPMGLQLWNSIRALDFLESLPEVDRRRIAVTGASGGATQTFLLAAVDDRVGYAAPVNMVSAYMQGGDPCEEAPNLRVDTFNVELAAMMAPRPMLIVSASRDWTRHTPVEEFPAIRRVYQLYGVPQNVSNAHFQAQHNYNRQSREAVYRFLAKYLQPGLSASALVDKAFDPPREDDLLAWSKSDLPDSLPALNGVFRDWKAATPLLGSDRFAPEQRRQALAYALAVEWPDQVESMFQGNRVVLSRSGKADRVTGLWSPGSGQPVLVVHPGGVAAAQKIDTVVRLLQSGRPVLLLEPFSSGSLRLHRQRWDDYFLSYNQADAADRVQDILTALAFLQPYGTPELIGLKEAGPWCLFAAAVAPMQLEVTADLNGFSGSDEDFRDRFPVPGIQRAGGLESALELVPNRQLIQPVLQTRR